MSSRVQRLLAALPAVALAALPALAPLPAAAQAPAQAPAKTRVYLMVVDGLRPDEVALMPFLSSLAAEGTYYQEARGVMVAETIPNHTAMITGVGALRNGIVANSFPGVAGGSEAELGAGDEPVEAGDPRLLQADSLFTLVERQCPQLTTAAVMSKDYLFTLMGHDRTGDGRPDVDSNFDNTSDPFFLPGFDFTPDERTGVEALRVSRALDPQLMFVNLGSVDRVGHVDESGGLPTGTAPAARTAQLLTTDTNLRLLVEELRTSGRWKDTAFVVMADHSMNWSEPGATVTVSDNPEIADIIGEFGVAQNGGAALFTLRDRSRPDAAQLLARLRASAVATDGVDEALYRTPNPLDGGEANWVGAVHPDWEQTGPRSGDLLVTVADGRRSAEPASLSNPLPGNHGMPSTQRVPAVVSGGIGVVPLTVTGSSDPDVRDPASAEAVDLGTTAAWLLGVEPPAGGFDGRVLSEAFTARPEPVCVQAAGAAPPAAAPAPAPAAAPASAAPSSSRRLAATGPLWLLPAAGLVLAGAGAVALRRRQPRA